ncbi:MAG: hypothetical protein GX596_07095 [Propionibacterium sp.]|nr:hypothetical protein [Propionibacterium sp.]
MYSMTGVIQPDLDVDAYSTLAGHYATLAAQADSTVGSTQSAVSAVLAANDGEAAAAFQSTVTGGGSITEHFADLGPAARRTESAYRTTATSAATARFAMDMLVQARTLAYWQGLANGADLHALSLLVNLTRNDLRALEGQSVEEIETAFAALDLPGRFETPRQDTYGRIDPAIEEQWAGMSDEERMEVLQNIADAYADEMGYPRMDITFTPIKNDTGTTWGSYNDGSLFGIGSSLKINSDELHDPHLINTVVHEMQHRGQYQGMRGPTFPWQDERAGMTREEAERWSELNESDVRTKGGDSNWEQYEPRPIEVDARRAGRDFVDDLSHEEFQEFVP